VFAFVVLKGDRPTGEKAEAFTKVLREHVSEQLGAIARPDDVRFADNLPKTRSGKIMRRLLRDIAENRELGDVTTLTDSSVMTLIKENLATAKASED
jgi:acetyl-CoA synthetase